MGYSRRSNIINRYRAFKSMCTELNGADPLASARLPYKLKSIVKQGDDISEYIAGLISLMKGGSYLKDVCKRLLERYLPLIESQMRKEYNKIFLKSNISSQKIDDTDCLKTGFYIPMDIIDSFSFLKSNKSKGLFEQTISDTITSGNKGVIDGVLSIEYDKPSNSILVKALPELYDNKVYTVLEAMGNGISIGISEVIDELMDLLFSLFSGNRKTDKRRAVIEKALNQNTEALEYTKFDFQSALGVKVQSGYISGYDCDGNFLKISQQQVDQIYESQQFVETLYSTVKDMGGIGNEAQSENLGKNIIKALFASILNYLMFSSSLLFRFIVGDVLMGDCRIPSIYFDFDKYVNYIVKKISCLIERMKKDFLQALVDELKDIIEELGLCIVRQYAKDRIEGYNRVLGTLSLI